MRHCPSHDWDRYCDQHDPPDECVVCGAVNFDEDTDAPTYAPEPACCSKACADKLEQQYREEAEAEAAEYEALKELNDELSSF
jgi:hypothetical protein